MHHKRVATAAVGLLIFTIARVQSRAYSGIHEHHINDIEAIDYCNATAPVNLETFEQLLNFERLLPENHSQIKHFECFLHCIFTKYGVMDEEGGFMLHSIKEILEDAMIEKEMIDLLVYKCSATESTNKCRRAFEYTKCFWMNSIEPEKEEEDNFMSKFEYRLKRFVMH